MPMLLTSDEQDTGFFSTNPAAYSDAPFSLSSPFTLASGAFNSAKGLLPVAFGIADKDIYALGTLFKGSYSFSASGSLWFFGNGYVSYISPKISLLDAQGNVVSGGFSSFASVNISTPGNYFLLVQGDTSQSSQYEASYTYTQETNLGPSSNSLTIGGQAKVGETVTTSGSFSDGNGLTFANATFGYKTSWFTAVGSEVEKVGDTSSYTVKANDAGKSLFFLIGYTDDAGYFESAPSNIVQVPNNLNSPPTGQVVISGSPTQGQTLTATNTLSDLDGLGPINYTWKSGTTTLGTGQSYTLTQAEVGKTIALTASYIDGLGTIESVTSAPTEAILNINDPPSFNTSPPLNATQGVEYSYSLTVFDPDRDDVYFDLSKMILPSWMTRTGSTFSGTPGQVDVGVHQVKISIFDSNGGQDSQEFVVTVENVNDSPTGDVWVEGAPKQGQTLTASNTLSDVDGIGEITYTWKAGSAILGTGSSFKLTQAEVGKAITVTASYTDGFGAVESKVSALTAAIENLNDAPYVFTSPPLNGTQGIQYRYPLTVVDADGDQVYFDFSKSTLPSWLSWDGSAFAGTPTQEHVGENPVTIWIFDNYGGSSSQQFSIAVANINDLPTGSVNISGEAILGGILTASNSLSDLDGLGLVTYTWFASGTTVGTGDTYKITEADVGKKITLTASYIDGGDFFETVTSEATETVIFVNRQPTGTVTISGTPTQGQTLVASNTLSDADGLGLIAYTWSAGSTNIGTGPSYTLAQSDVGKLITVTAVFTDGGNTIESVKSDPTVAVLNIDDESTGTLLLSGKEVVGASVSASVANLDDIDGSVVSISWQWQRQSTDVNDQPLWIDIPDATNTDLTIPINSDFVGSAVRVVLTTIDSTGGSSILASDPTAPIEGLQVKVHTQFWADTRPISGIVIHANNTDDQTVTNIDGKALLEGIANPNVSLSTHTSFSPDQVLASSEAISLQDAVTILKMIAGQSANTGETPTSRFQSLAADYDGSGTVSLADALGVLRHSVGLQSQAPSWVFVEESAESNSSILNPGAPGPIAVELSSGDPVQVNLIGVLRGDVDGSYGVYPG